MMIIAAAIHLLLFYAHVPAFQPSALWHIFHWQPLHFKEVSMYCCIGSIVFVGVWPFNLLEEIEALRMFSVKTFSLQLLPWWCTLYEHQFRIIGVLQEICISTRFLSFTFLHNTFPLRVFFILGNTCICFFFCPKIEENIDINLEIGIHFLI